MITPKDQVSMIAGRVAADILDEEGLIIKHYGGIAPTHWRVDVRVTAHTGQNVYPDVGRDRSGRPPHSLATGLAQPLWAFYYPRSHADYPDHGSHVFESEHAAERQAAMARKCGLQVKITPLALVEVTAVAP